MRGKGLVLRSRDQRGGGGVGCNKQSHAIIIIFFPARPSVLKVGTGFFLDLPRAVFTSSLIWGHDENPAAWVSVGCVFFFSFFLSQAACVYK